MKTAKIYYLTPSNNQNDIRYIGKTSFSLEKRLNEHIKDIEINHRTNWVKSIFQQNFKLEIHLLDIVPESEWKFWEIHYISLFKSWGFDLTNSTLGGEGVHKGFKHSEESKEKNKKYKRKYWEDLNEEEKEKAKKAISEGKQNSSYNYSKDIERNKKISKNRINKGLKPILQLDPITLEIIAEYPSIKSAYKVIKNADIGSCLDGSCGQSGGWKWKYKSQPTPEFIPKYIPKRVFQIDPVTNQIVKIWDNYNKISKELNWDIYYILTGKSKSGISYNYKWVYEEDYNKQLKVV